MQTIVYTIMLDGSHPSPISWKIRLKSVQTLVIFDVIWVFSSSDSLPLLRLPFQSLSMRLSWIKRHHRSSRSDLGVHALRDPPVIISFMLLLHIHAREPECILHAVLIPAVCVIACHINRFILTYSKMSLLHIYVECILHFVLVPAVCVIACHRPFRPYIW
ncbi:hypothetical protein DEU56DRAFT_774285 [Suillus clintonianus]|uniref:uncharacterized protein n=1 Tax=Suillus clintonianus TaxID=1904413 RepID=UPI001B87B60B|nr:uncharacterized protein DEU56DRAFT_774285 [Suillus clintonianus]KAG2153295.1 hypothetical protein DEU56DRAFT_774285 [Suillus clintonianus]